MKRKVTALIAATAMAVSLLPSAAFGAIGGDGSAAEPYTINSLEDLKEFRDKVNDGDKYSEQAVTVAGQTAEPGKTIVAGQQEQDETKPDGDGDKPAPDKAAATGDDTNMIPFIVAVIAALLCGLVVVFARKRK